MRKLVLFLSFFLLAAGILEAGPLESRLQKIMNRPEFRHATFGIHFLSLEKKQTLYALNANKFFIPASTTKLITAGSALEILGPDYRFPTRIYRTGEVINETLQGDLVLVASGDPNLSSRVTEGEALLFENEDHSYGGEHSRGVGEDPLRVIRKLAKQVAGHKIKRISGRVLVDATLFKQGDRELGTGVVISPIVVNDNVMDVLVKPGDSENAAVAMKVAPLTSYVRIVNRAITGKSDSDPDLRWDSDIENSDGSRTVTLAGSLPANGPETMFSYAVPDPARYGEMLLTEALREEGIVANARLKEDQPDFKSLATFYKSENQVAEHISPPMKEEIKIILKVSQNLHASMMPYVLASVVAKKEAPQSGFDLMREFLAKAGLNDDAASQEDGAGGSANFTPEFMTSYLAYWARHKEAKTFHDALPILGKDGTLFQIQVYSAAAGHVFAKTGTYGRSDLLHKRVMVDSKALAGYVTTKKGHSLAFAIFVNHVPVSSKPHAIREITGQAMGEIAAAAYELL
ncbi:D-alanyl-D-alanine carboxypeptidase/D-alanyl-D-alanine-endopeptidase [bacterium]|nr:D-alanyl-D-alanine carboxypeptidase/D-alanyl-D-alanine-endopeptidase [bacterium]MCI0603560.1 D-alanyl-D-alanine carboxypeptidase/D-alanyl-D-alanine-endopeptidase [bacterium]